VTLVVRLIIDMRPGQRLVNVQLAEPPRRGDVVSLADGTRVAIKKVREPPRGDSAHLHAYATVVR
jgi:hypothetical protein